MVAIPAAPATTEGWWFPSLLRQPPWKADGPTRSCAGSASYCSPPSCAGSVSYGSSPSCAGSACFLPRLHLVFHRIERHHLRRVPSLYAAPPSLYARRRRAAAHVTRHVTPRQVTSARRHVTTASLLTRHVTTRHVIRASLVTGHVTRARPTRRWSRASEWPRAGTGPATSCTTDET